MSIVYDVFVCSSVVGELWFTGNMAINKGRMKKD